jgi:sulfur carrier protein
MRIYLNGKTHEVEADTLADALKALDYADAIIATAVNGQFVQAAARNDFQLTDGDQIEVVAPMQGG